MRITFESVSYSYANPKAQEKKKKHAKKLRDKGIAEKAPSLESHGKATWGTDPEGIWALRTLDFSIEEGEFFGIAGHTGSGKSTLIQHMNGLIHPTEGRVLINDDDLALKGVGQKYRGKVGLVFQYPEHQLFAASVNEDVAFGPKNLGLSEEDIKIRVKDALIAMNFNPEEIGEKNPFELSGGQQRRVAFAGILAMNPEILVLDEPVAGLDPVAREEFLTLIAKLHSKGLTIVMVSHSMEDLARLSDRILVLNEGSLFDLGTPTEVFAHGDNLRSIGLDVPAAQKLAADLNNAGIVLDQDLYDLESLANHLALLYKKQHEGLSGDNHA